MTPNEYQQNCLRTWQSGQRSSLEELANAALGLTGEAGEVGNKVKKVVWYDKAMNEDEIADELGDVLYYAAILAHKFGYTLEAVMRGNILKLAARHPDGFNSRHYNDDSPGGALTDIGKRADHA